MVTIPQNSLYPATFHNNLLFAEVNGGTLHRIVLAGAQLDHLGAVSIAFKGGLGGLLDIIQGPGGYLYASGFNAIYRVIPKSQSVSEPQLSPANHIRAHILRVIAADDQSQLAVIGYSI